MVPRYTLVGQIHCVVGQGPTTDFTQIIMQRKFHRSAEAIGYQREHYQYFSTEDTRWRLADSAKWMQQVDVRSISFSPLLAALLKQLSNQPGPTCLMARSHGCAGIAMKVFMERHVGVPMRILLKI